MAFRSMKVKALITFFPFIANGGTLLEKCKWYSGLLQANRTRQACRTRTDYNGIGIRDRVISG